jgi:hypothetical protein
LIVHLDFNQRVIFEGLRLFVRVFVLLFGFIFSIVFGFLFVPFFRVSVGLFYVYVFFYL